MFCKLTPEEEVRMHLLLRGVADGPNAQEMKKIHPARQCHNL